jgi:hypothetical protein
LICNLGLARQPEPGIQLLFVQEAEDFSRAGYLAADDFHATLAANTLTAAETADTEVSSCGHIKQCFPGMGVNGSVFRLKGHFNTTHCFSLIMGVIKSVRRL